jgi:hypothetical protein
MATARLRTYFERFHASQGGPRGKRLLEQGRARRADQIHARVPSTREMPILDAGRGYDRLVRIRGGER